MKTGAPELTLAKWVEVWTDDDGYVVVVKELPDGKFELADPQAQSNQAFTTYEELKEELLQDEFHRVEGREHFRD